MKSFFSSIESNKSVFFYLRNIWLIQDFRRRYQSIIVLFLALTNGFAEIISISAIIPILNLIVNPGSYLDSNMLNIFEKLPFALSEENFPIVVLLIYVFAVFFTSGLKIINVILFARFGASLGNDFSDKIFNYFIRTDYQIHKSRNSSEIVSNIVLYTDDTVASIVSILHLIACLINTLFITLALLLYDPKLAFTLIFLLALVYLFIGFKVRLNLFKNNQISTLLNKERIQKIQESASNLREIILGDLYNLYSQNYNKLDKKSRHARAQNMVISMLPRYIVEFIALVLIAVIAIFFLNSSNSSNENIILLGFFAVGAQKLLPTVQQSFAYWSSFKGTSYALFKIISILIKIKKSEIKFYNKKQVSRNYSKSYKFNKIQVEDISFNYLNTKGLILKTKSFSINKGEKVVIIGKSGQGKSTLLDIISGLLAPNKGFIKINGEDINKSISYKSNWQKMIGYVSQTVILKDDTLISNIAFNHKEDDQIDKAWLNQVIDISGLYDCVDSLPNGLNTVVGENGGLLSGGQRQRVSLARAIFQKPKILLLDEATSALDKNLESKIIENLCNSFPYEITIIAVTHNKEILKSFDRIFEIKNKTLYEVT